MPTNLQASVARLSATFMCSFLAVFAVLAQSDLTTEADQLFERRGYHESAREYVAIYAKVKSDIDLKGYCAFQAGESYRLYHEAASAIEWYDKAIGLKYGKRNTDLYLVYGDVLRDQEKFDDAVKMYERFKNEGGDANVASMRIEKTNKAADMLEEPESRYEVELMLTLNSPGLRLLSCVYRRRTGRCWSSRHPAILRKAVKRIPSRDRNSWICSAAKWTTKAVGANRSRWATRSARRTTKVVLVLTAKGVRFTSRDA